MMASNFNNVANRSMDDFFVTRQYNGEIYKTTNLQNRPLAEYCKTDSAMMKEQKRIETELVSFEKHLYGSDTLSTVVKPAIKEKVSAKKTAKAAAEETAVEQEAAAQPEETVKTNSKKKGREKQRVLPVLVKALNVRRLLLKLQFVDKDGEQNSPNLCFLILNTYLCPEF